MVRNFSDGYSDSSGGESVSSDLATGDLEFNIFMAMSITSWLIYREKCSQYKELKIGLCVAILMF